MYTNADTVTNKLNELFLLAESHQLDIIMVTEIKPKYSYETTDSARYKLEGYQMYTNLDADAHRGVAVYVENSLADLATEVNLDTMYNECTWLKLKLRGQDNLLIGCVYRSPSSPMI